MDSVRPLLLNVLAMTLCYLLLVDGTGMGLRHRRIVTGWHYIQTNETQNLTIACDLFNGQNRSVCLYNGSLQGSCGGSSLMVPKHGGIIECRKEDQKNTPCSLQCTNNNICNSCSTFIISPIPDQKTPINQTSQIIRTKDSVKFSCEFNRSNFFFISFWVVVYPNRGNHCLFSLDNDGYDFNKNTYCHSVSGVQNRIHFFNLTSPSDKIQKQHLEIRTADPSDSGTYLCFYFVWKSGELIWELGNNISLQVQDSTQEKKIKLQRNPDTVDLPNDYECTPYAISDRKAIEVNPDCTYSVVTKPEQAPEGEYSEVNLTPTGADLCVPYSVVNVKQQGNQ
ncbi:hypothetical protein XENTR_v10009131 [Xenopus tropicalis]|nr:hypothetical protein XENTR_v10009131 [Xenopus tropicalis]